MLNEGDAERGMSERGEINGTDLKLLFLCGAMKMDPHPYPSISLFKTKLKTFVFDIAYSQGWPLPGPADT